MKITKQQLLEDVQFLSRRQKGASSISFCDNKRCTGTSSNSIIALVYGTDEKQSMPHDAWDYLACWRAVNMLPEHRRERGEYYLQFAFASLDEKYKWIALKEVEKEVINKAQEA